MDHGPPAPPPPLGDEAFGAVIQLANAASRPDHEQNHNSTNPHHFHHQHPSSNSAHTPSPRVSKGRGDDMSENPRSSKHVRMENESPHSSVDAPSLSWAPTAPPAYPGHGLDHNGMPTLHHSAPSPFDPTAHDVSAYGDTSGVQSDQSRMAPPPPAVASPTSEQNKHLTSEQTGLVGARGKTGMTRTLSTSRRAEQNRNAQRVFRERKNKYIADLESKAASLESALLAAEEHRRRFNEAIETIEILKRDNDTLRVALRALGGHQAVPNAPALPIDRPASHAPTLLPTFAQQHPGAPGAPPRGVDQHDATHAQSQGGMHDTAEQAQDPATAAAVAAAASGGAPYWLLEAVSNANQQHGFHVPNHFSSQLGDSGMPPPGPPTQIHPNDPNAMRARGGMPPQRAESMLDPSLEHATLGDAPRPPSRVHGEDNKTNDSGMDAAGNPDNLASLSAVAAAAAAAAASQKVNT